MSELLLGQTLRAMKKQYAAKQSINKLLNQAIKIADLYEQELRCHRAREVGQTLAGVLEDEATETLKCSGVSAENVIFPDFGGRTK